MQRPFALEWLECTIKDRQMLRFQSAAMERNRLGCALRSVRKRDACATFYVFDSVERVDMRDDTLDLIRAVAKLFQRRFNRLVNNLEHAASGEELVFYQRNVGFDSCCVEIHEETDCARGREHSYLRIAISVTFPNFRRVFPRICSLLFQMRELFSVRNLVDRAAMQLD